eukprot:INCI15124.1.p1 GENE.INCI15124.1~~INCI15124.1.p1  ORF type:complete len:511 (-),score=60.33 INCI15124.1:438-1970(-)
MHHASDPLPFRCTSCDACFRRHKELVDHVSEAHDGAQEQLKCPHCSFRSKWAGTLRMHVEKQHSALRSIRCEHCAYACSKPGTLLMHVRRKHPNQFQKITSSISYAEPTKRCSSAGASYPAEEVESVSKRNRLVSNAKALTDSAMQTAAQTCAATKGVPSSASLINAARKSVEDITTSPDSNNGKAGTSSTPTLDFQCVFTAQTVLVVGEMDFSFSMDITKLNPRQRAPSASTAQPAQPAQPTVVCTSYLPWKELLQAGKLTRKVSQNTRVLLKRGALVRFSVDGRSIAATLLHADAHTHTTTSTSPTPIDSEAASKRKVAETVIHFSNDKDVLHQLIARNILRVDRSCGSQDSCVKTGRCGAAIHTDSAAALQCQRQLLFEAIFFCFPRASLQTGTADGAAALNAQLLADFFRSAKDCLAPSGRIVVLLHVCILCGVRSDQYHTWAVEKVAFESAGLRRVGVVRYDPNRFGTYQPRARDGRPFRPDEAFFHVFQRQTDADAANIQRTHE